MQYIGDNVAFLTTAFTELLKTIEAQQERLAASGDADASAPVNRKLAFLRKRVPRALAGAKEGVEIVSRIVRAMKDFSHVDVSERTACDLNAALDNALAVSRSEWRHVAKVETELAEDLPPLECFGAEIKQVFLNLIVNAAHAVGERYGPCEDPKGRIGIATGYDEEAIKVVVSDNGIGIPEEIQHRIYDPFFTTKAVGKGTGQGLSLAHTVIVNKHGGTLCVQSTPNQGTVFTIELPRP